jgi:hypothetical protein
MKNINVLSTIFLFGQCNISNPIIFDPNQSAHKNMQFTQKLKGGIASSSLGKSRKTMFLRVSKIYICCTRVPLVYIYGNNNNNNKKKKGQDIAWSRDGSRVLVDIVATKKKKERGKLIKRNKKHIY